MKKKQLPFLFILAIVLASCSGSSTQNTDIAAAVALTQTAAGPVNTANSQIVEVTVTSEAGSQPMPMDGGRIEFSARKTTWYTHADLAAGATARYTLPGQAGQQVTIWLTPDSAPDGTNLSAMLNISAADGQSFSFSPEIYWSNVLPTTQDYYIDVSSLSQDPVNYQIVVEANPTLIDPAQGTMYDPIPDNLCQELGTIASQALGVEFNVQTRAPFFDAINKEAGQGCSLSAGGDGTQFISPHAVVDTLVNSVGMGWNLLPMYQADGPTGTATGLSRDMGLMIISTRWEPAMGVECPTDQPISACELQPEQKNYSVNVDIAQYKATFSLDGHWEDPTTGFTLDLYQDWKTIYGMHTMMADGGNKTDSLDTSINGKLHGNVADVQFQSSFTSDVGTAQLTYLDVSTMEWKIIDPPDGEYYLPAEATLIRK